jgi:hypothetical protein
MNLDDIVSLVKVVDTDDIPDDAVVICVYATAETPFGDNLKGVCAMCGVGVQFRPYTPAKLRKLCIPCGMVAVESEGATKQ